MTRPVPALILAVMAALLPTTSRADSVALAVPPAELHVPVVVSAPPLDGTLNSPVWKEAATTTLTYDLHTHGAAQEPTTVYLVSDGTSLYVGFNAEQTRTPILANQRTNNVGQDTDDETCADSGARN